MTTFLHGRRTTTARLKRRGRLLAAASGAVVALLAGLLVPLGGDATTPAAAATATPPNVVIVLTDDQRIMTMSRMPSLWNLIRRKGVSYPNAMVPTSLCCPSRATILTGLYAHSTGVYSNGLPDGGWDVFHDRGMEDRTIAVALDKAGYRNGFVGKYINGPFPQKAAAGYVPPGWDFFRTFTTAPNYYNYKLNNGKTYGSRAADYSTDVLRREAVGFIRSTPANQPLFLYFSTIGPHRPFTPAPRHVGAWRGRIPSYRPPSVVENVRDKPPWVRVYGQASQKKIDADMASAQESLMSIDHAVKNMVTALTDTGRMRNTLFVFLSDNGLMMGEHHLYTWKNLPYRLATSIPMVARWDGRIKPYSTDWRLALNVDLAATVDAATPATMSTQGLDLLGSQTRGGFPLEGGTWRQFDSLPKHPAYCGYRTKNWMYTRYATGEEELYSYKVDPHEVLNRAPYAKHRAQLQAMRARAKATCLPKPPNFTWKR